MSRRLAVVMVALSMLFVVSGLAAPTPVEAQGLPIPDCFFNPTSCVDDIADGLLDEIVERVDTAFGFLVFSFLEGGVNILEAVVGWWIDVPNRVGNNTGLIESIQFYFYGLTGFMVVGGVMVAGIRLIVSRKAEPLADLIRATIVFSLVSAVGITLVQGVAAASDAWAGAVLESALDDQSVDQALTGLADTNTALLFVIGLLMIVAGLIQAAFMLLREMSLIILTGLVVIAASGQYFQATRHWLSNLLSMIIPIILWKPIAAVMLAIAFQFLGEGAGMFEVLVGIVLIIGSAFAWMPLMRIFSIFNPANSNAGSGGRSGFASAAGMGALAIMNNRSQPAAGGAAPSTSSPSPSAVSSPSSGGAAAGGAAGGGAAAGGAGSAAAMTAISIVQSGGRASGSALTGKTPAS